MHIIFIWTYQLHNSDRIQEINEFGQIHFNFIFSDLLLFRMTKIIKTAAAQLNAIVANVMTPLTPAFPIGMLALSERFE